MSGSEDSDRAAFLRGIDEFNRRLFFECHDTWEDVWRGTRGADRDFYQGLIQVAVGFYHLDNGNRRGAESQLEKGLARLAPYPENHTGIDLGTLREEAGRWLALLRVEGTLPQTPPRIRTRQ